MRNLNHARETVRNWNAAFPIGTVVIFQGEELKTWSHAGIGVKGEPSVFLDNGPDAAVPIKDLEIPGYKMQPVNRRKRPNERPA